MSIDLTCHHHLHTDSSDASMCKEYYAIDKSLRKKGLLSSMCLFVFACWFSLFTFTSLSLSLSLFCYIQPSSLPLVELKALVVLTAKWWRPRFQASSHGSLASTLMISIMPGQRFVFLYFLLCDTHTHTHTHIWHLSFLCWLSKIISAESSLLDGRSCQKGWETWQQGQENSHFSGPNWSMEYEHQPRQLLSLLWALWKYTLVIRAVLVLLGYGYLWSVLCVFVWYRC